MKVIWIISLERVPTRYTWQWGDFIPSEIVRQASSRALTTVRHNSVSEFLASVDTADLAVVDVVGELPEQSASEGAFLNFASTNIWKSSQMKQVAEVFHAGKVTAGDIFYFTDAWNPGIIQVKYMSELLGVPVKIVGQWHAGAHDPWDFLGRKISDKKWVFEFERSVFHALDYNFFTTSAYIRMFFDNLGMQIADLSKVARTGYPNGYLLETLPKYIEAKEDLILFPHRISPEKQLDIFLDLSKELPQYNWVVCQEKQLSKEEYHRLLGKAKLVFSAALQETYGIAQTEAVVARAMPLSPERLSYSEMYLEEYLYPSKWTESFESYLEHKPELVDLIRKMMQGYFSEESQTKLTEQLDFLIEADYIGGKYIWNSLLD